MPPILLHYYITHRCNCRCSFCDIWKISAKKGDDAQLQDVLRNLRHARQLGVRFVDFTGGEPLLHDDLPQMLEEAKRIGLRTTVTSNGLLYPKSALELKGRVDLLHFSLDALDPQKHDAIRGRQTFASVMKSIDLARKLDETPDLLFTVNEDNLSEIKPLSEFARALGLMLIVNPVFSYAGFTAPEIKVLEVLDRYRATPFVYVNSAFHRLRRRGGNDIRAPRCRVVDSTIVISPDDKIVLPCWHFQQKGINVGRLQEDTRERGNRLEQIRQSRQWRYFQRRQGRFEFCQGCHLNCYFDPSFLYRMDDYFWTSLLAKSRYWWHKNILRRLATHKTDKRPAMTVAQEIVRKHDPAH